MMNGKMNMDSSIAGFLSFVCICTAVGDPVIKTGGLAYH